MNINVSQQKMSAVEIHGFGVKPGFKFWLSFNQSIPWFSPVWEILLVLQYSFCNNCNIAIITWDISNS